MSLRPHIPYFFAGYRFGPRAMAPTEGGVWVGDSFLPVMVWVDADSGVVSGPYRVDRGEARGSQMQVLVVAEGAVWVAWDGAVSRFDPVTARTTAVFPGSGVWALAFGEGAVWTLSGDGAVVRLDVSGEHFGRLSEPERGRFKIAVGHGSVWTLGWGEPAADRTLLSRLNPRTGRMDSQHELEGNMGLLAVDSTGVWATVSRRTSSRTVSFFVQHVDPERDQVVGEWEAPYGLSLTVNEGVLWTPAFRPPDRPDLPLAMSRLLAATGELLDATIVDGRLSCTVAGESGVWACLRRDSSGAEIIGFVDHEHEPVVIELGDVDVGSHLPPPPEPIDAETEERRVRADVEKILHGGWVHTDPDTGIQTSHPYIAGIDFEAVALEGSFPSTEVVIFFRSERHPDVLFGRRARIWEDSGALSDCDAGIITINLMEKITACRYGLPDDPKLDPTGVAWF